MIELVLSGKERFGRNSGYLRRNTTKGERRGEMRPPEGNSRKRGKKTIKR